MLRGCWFDSGAQAAHQRSDQNENHPHRESSSRESTTPARQRFAQKRVATTAPDVAQSEATGLDGP
ncbi:MAG TPA: hypothetical protein VFT98_16390, partial [Myxococcota bacterium]|nr:hypothetical protein [Myxococcota bacterium]